MVPKQTVGNDKKCFFSRFRRKMFPSWFPFHQKQTERKLENFHEDERNERPIEFLVKWQKHSGQVFKTNRQKNRPLGSFAFQKITDREKHGGSIKNKLIRFSCEHSGLNVFAFTSISGQTGRRCRLPRREGPTGRHALAEGLLEAALQLGVGHHEHVLLIARHQAEKQQKNFKSTDPSHQSRRN